MALIDRNFQFLQKCKKLQHENNLQHIIIPDRYVQPSSLLPYQQIMASQYASAMLDENINPSCIKSLANISLPVCLALFSKIVQESNLPAAEQLMTMILKQNHGGNINKHILTYNLAKLSSLQGNFKKSLLYCESLLIQSGSGSDYYTYQFLTSLIKQKRIYEALKVARRHVQNLNLKHKIQSIFIVLIDNIYEKDEKSLLRKVDKIFGNRKLCIRNYYNLALLLKNRVPQKSLQMFKKLDFHFQKLCLRKFQLMCKINIFQIYENFHLSPKYSQISKPKLKQILEQCERILNYLQEKMEVCQLFEARKTRVLQKLNQINIQIKRQNNVNFFQAINFTTKNSNFNPNPSKDRFQCDEIMSEAEYNKQDGQQYQNISQSKFYNEKRAMNQKRLRFLLKKERQLKNFFNKVKIQRKGQKMNIKLLNTSSIDKHSRSIDNLKQQDMLQAQQKFEQRKKKFRILYEQGQVNNIINDFIQDWMTPHQNNAKVKIKNIQNINKFVISLQGQDEEHENQITENKNTPTNNHFHLTSRSALNTSLSKRSSYQTFRVKNNSSRKNTDKMFRNLKNNDHIANQMIINLKNNVAEKKKQDKSNQFQKKNFKQKLHQGELLEQQNKLEEAHEHFVQMYKNFKEDFQKQILLLKIAQNFENLSFFDEAQKTYIKCTKFNNTQAFFKLGLLQIKCGKIQIGIQNLQKANCIDRHNSKIQIKLVYAYSLLEETTDRALALANSILKRNPQCIQALIMTSKILQKKGKLKQALDIALAIGNSYGSAPTFHYIGLLYLNDSNVNEAFQYFHKAIQIQSDHLPSLIELATILSEARSKQAIDILKNVLSLDPQNQLAFARLGKIYESFENDYENALLVYKKGLQYSPSYQNYTKIGDCHLKLGSIVDAYLNYKQALAIKKAPQILQKIAEVHELQHQDKKAIETYSMALAQLPKDNSSYAKRKKYLFRLGKLSLQAQQFDVAHGYLCEVADMEESFEVLKMLGQACYGKGDYNEALHYYEQAAGMESEDNLELLQNIAMCFDKQEQYLTSKQIYERILSVDPKNIRCLNNLANIFLIQGKTNQAFYWFEFMLQQVPTSIQKRIRVSDIYATIGDWSKVEQHLLICYKQKQNDIRVLERMVNLYKQKRDTKQLNKFEKRLTLIKGNNKSG